MHATPLATEAAKDATPGAEEAGTAPAAAEGEPERIVVRDRRFWARPAESDAAETVARPADKPSFVRELEAKLAAAEGARSQVVAQYQAAKSEFEAARARLRRELAREAERGVDGLLVGLLEVVDNLDRALAQPPPAGAEALHQGVALVREQFLARLAGLGVSPMPEAIAFDAHRHEALAQLPAEAGQAPGSIAAVIRPGYMRHEAVLRPAQVAVVAAPVP